jgi:hypothetical protein
VPPPLPPALSDGRMSWPCWLQPQVTTPPSSSTHAEWAAPHATATARGDHLSFRSASTFRGNSLNSPSLLLLLLLLFSFLLLQLPLLLLALWLLPLLLLTPLPPLLLPPPPLLPSWPKRSEPQQ